MPVEQPGERLTVTGGGRDDETRYPYRCRFTAISYDPHRLPAGLIYQPPWRPALVMHDEAVCWTLRGHAWFGPVGACSCGHSMIWRPASNGATGRPTQVQRVVPCPPDDTRITTVPLAALPAVSTPSTQPVEPVGLLRDKATRAQPPPRRR